MKLPTTCLHLMRSWGLRTDLTINCISVHFPRYHFSILPAQQKPPDPAPISIILVTYPTPPGPVPGYKGPTGLQPFVTVHSLFNLIFLHQTSPTYYCSKILFHIVEERGQHSTHIFEYFLTLIFDTLWVSLFQGVLLLKFSSSCWLSPSVQTTSTDLRTGIFFLSLSSQLSCSSHQMTHSTHGSQPFDDASPPPTLLQFANEMPESLQNNDKCEQLISLSATSKGWNLHTSCPYQNFPDLVSPK